MRMLKQASKVMCNKFSFWLAVFYVLWIPFLPTAFAKTYDVRTIAQLKQTLSELKAGDTVEIHSGIYKGGVLFEGLTGRKNKPITIKGKNPKNPPLFTGGKTTLNFSRCHYLQLKNLNISGAKENGIHVHDGNTGQKKNKPSRNILLEHITVTDTGPVGNFDAIKMSGVTSFVIRNCVISGWGGSGIDMVGCSYGRITSCKFKGKKGFSQGNGIQIKGGSKNILVEKSFFVKAGRRGINLGGMTGFRWFRPEVGYFEAKNIEVGGNVFYGGTAIAFVTSQSGFVHHNAILYPTGYVFRILQEREDPRFMPCGNSLITKNIIVVDNRFKNFLNIGLGTNPGSFMFSENVWYDSFANRKPELPSIEKNPVYGVNPGLVFKNNRVYYLSKDPRLKGKGPLYYKSK